MTENYSWKKCYIKISTDTPSPPADITSEAFYPTNFELKGPYRFLTWANVFGGFVAVVCSEETGDVKFVYAYQLRFDMSGV